MKELRSISWVIEVENAMEGELAKKVWWLTQSLTFSVLGPGATGATRVKEGMGINYMAQYVA
jgi:hypothetical protein